jgi:hypothetical protein
MFKDGQTNVQDEERSGQTSVLEDDLVQSVDQKFCERQRFTISERLCEFPHISHAVLYEIITDRLGNHKFCARSGIKTWLTQAYRNLFPDTKSASNQAVTTLRSSLSMYLFFNFVLSLIVFLTALQRLLSKLPSYILKT